VLSPNSYIWTLLVPVLAVALLAPVAVGPLTRLLMWPFTRSARAGAILVRASALTARRRTAATATPVLLTVGLSLSLLAATDSVNEARDKGLRNQVSADYALTPDGTPGISQEVIDQVAGIDGVRVAAPILTTIYTRDDDRLEENDGLVVDPVALADTFHLDVVDGALSDLDDDTIVVAEAWGLDVNARVEVLMADGSTPTFRVAATYRALRGQDVAYLSSKWAQTGRYARNGLVRRAYLTWAPGGDQAATLAAVRAAVTGSGARLMSTEELVASESAFSRKLIAVRQRSVAGIVVLFCFIAIVNTLLMATADRRRDLAVLRLAGATPRQVLTVFVGESLLVAGIGVVLALLASALSLAGLWVALTRLFGTTPLVIPYGVVAGIAAIATLLAVLGTVLPVRASLRARAVALAGVRE
jgi:putative ABC transport system permease protein